MHNITEMVAIGHLFFWSVDHEVTVQSKYEEATLCFHATSTSIVPRFKFISCVSASHAVFLN